MSRLFFFHTQEANGDLDWSHSLSLYGKKQHGHSDNGVFYARKKVIQVLNIKRVSRDRITFFG